LFVPWVTILLAEKTSLEILEYVAYICETCIQDAVLVGELRDRSRKASGNAEVRKRKAALIERIKGLEGLVKKGKVEKAIVGTRQQDVRFLWPSVCLFQAVADL
jgi:hypothetical protein